MADKTTNFQLQKIDSTDYAGNFPTIYNNNLDLIDGINEPIEDLYVLTSNLNKNKQQKLIAGSGITIDSDGTIRSSGKEYTAGNGIQISSDGVISTIVPIGTYTSPFVVSASILNNVKLSITKVNLSNFCTKIEVKRFGDVVTSNLSNVESSTTKETSFAYSSTNKECQIKINLSPILGKISRKNCVLDVLFDSHSDNSYKQPSGHDNFYLGGTRYLNYSPFDGELVNGYLTVNITITESNSSNYYGFPTAKIVSGQYSTFSLYVGSISVSSN